MRTAAPLRVLLGLQLVFMLGFSSVVPFFAAIGQSRYGLDAAAGAVAESFSTLAAWPLATVLPATLLPLARYGLRPAHELRHHLKCTPAAAGTTLDKERIP